MSGVRIVVVLSFPLGNSGHGCDRGHCMWHSGVSSECGCVNTCSCFRLSGTSATVISTVPVAPFSPFPYTIMLIVTIHHRYISLLPLPGIRRLHHQSCHLHRDRTHAYPHQLYGATFSCAFLSVSASSCSWVILPVFHYVRHVQMIVNGASSVMPLVNKDSCML